MSRKHSWTDEELVTAVRVSRSYRMVLIKLQLIPAGGNYEQIKRRINDLAIPTEHFMGQGWNVGQRYHTKSRPPLIELLIEHSEVQSYKLKQRLYEEGIKQPKCEICGWTKQASDGRIPVELDHINGNRYDDRLENLRILCPNCHSLQATHRGKNKRVKLARVS